MQPQVNWATISRPVGPSVNSVIPVFRFARPNASIEAAELSGMAARRMRHHDAANRPERPPLAAVRLSLGGGARRDGDRGSPGVSHWATAAETDQCGGTTLALAIECLAIAAVGHRALSARRAVFPVGYLLLRVERLRRRDVSRPLQRPYRGAQLGVGTLRCGTLDRSRRCQPEFRPAVGAGPVARAVHWSCCGRGGGCLPPGDGEAPPRAQSPKAETAIRPETARVPPS